MNSVKHAFLLPVNGLLHPFETAQVKKGALQDLPQRGVLLDLQKSKSLFKSLSSQGQDRRSVQNFYQITVETTWLKPSL